MAWAGGACFVGGRLETRASMCVRVRDTGSEPCWVNSVFVYVVLEMSRLSILLCQVVD